MHAPRVELAAADLEVAGEYTPPNFRTDSQLCVQVTYSGSQVITGIVIPEPRSLARLALVLPAILGGRRRREQVASIFSLIVPQVSVVFPGVVFIPVGRLVVSPPPGNLMPSINHV